MNKFLDFLAGFLCALILLIFIVVSMGSILFGIYLSAEYLYPLFTDLGLNTLGAKFLAFFFCLAIVVSIVLGASYACHDDEES